MSKGKVRKLFLTLSSLSDTFSILYGSGTLFFYSETQFLLLYGSNTLFFLSQTRLPIFSWHYVNLFPFSTGLVRTFSALGPDFCFYTGLKRSFSLLKPGFTFPVALELRLFLLPPPDSSLFHDSSHIFQQCFIPFSHLSGILILVKRKYPMTQFLFHNMAGKVPTSYRLLLLFIK